MKIVDVQTFLVGNVRPYHGGQCWLFVKLISDEGIEGIGEWSTAHVGRLESHSDNTNKVSWTCLVSFWTWVGSTLNLHSGGGIGRGSPLQTTTLNYLAGRQARAAISANTTSSQPGGEILPFPQPGARSAPDPAPPQTGNP